MSKVQTSFKPFIFFSIAIFIIWGLSEVIIYMCLDNWQDRGTFGDGFGAVNALFSGLAFAGIIFTILLQRQELQLQRQELVETRQELKRAADAQEKSEKALVKQMKTMNRTARLNGTNAILEYHNMRAQTRVSKGFTGAPELAQAENYARKIQLILDELEQESNDSEIG